MWQNQFNPIKQCKFKWSRCRIKQAKSLQNGKWREKIKGTTTTIAGGKNINKIVDLFELEYANVSASASTGHLNILSNGDLPLCKRWKTWDCKNRFRWWWIVNEREEQKDIFWWCCGRKDDCIECECECAFERFYIQTLVFVFVESTKKMSKYFTHSFIHSWWELRNGLIQLFPDSFLWYR